MSFRLLAMRMLEDSLSLFNLFSFIQMKIFHQLNQSNSIRVIQSTIFSILMINLKKFSQNRFDKESTKLPILVILCCRT